MISSQNLIDKICCTLTTGGLTPVQCCSAESALTILCQPVFSVANIAALPNATTYNSRMVYVTSEAKYYYAVLGVWSDDFSSVPHGVNSFSTYSWGYGGTGRLGDGCAGFFGKSSPVSVIGGFTDWCQVSAGSGHSLGVRQNGTAWGWGCNGEGRLGDNSTVAKSSPVSVVGGFTDWCQVSAGSAHSLGVRTGGTLYAWGQNCFGKLGDNTVVSKSSPVSVIGGFTDWCQVSAGGEQSLAVRQNGTAWSWGSGYRGQLGDNTTASKSSPVSVIGGFTDWCQVSAGIDNFSLAVRQNGTAWAWGAGTLGRLGNNYAGSDQQSPVSVIGGFTDWCQISAGSISSLAVRQNGTAWAWGSGSYGKLGDNSATNRSSPVSVVGGFTDWCKISAGNSFSLAIRTNGTAWAWGSGSYGKLGDNSTTNRSSPVSVVGGFTSWCRVSAGCNHSLAIEQATVGL
jgi:alpha-tubulin suppressor-like RCC1 family protein